jgi:amphi-Trp domain-containing protein
MSEEVIFADERHQSRSEVAEYLRAVADRPDQGGDVTFERGGDSVSVDVPPRVEFEVKVEREGPADGVGEIGLELELEWPEDAAERADAGDDSLSIS